MEENSLAQKLGAEVFGTAVLVFLGAGSVPALFLARGGKGGAPFTGAELFAISTAFGLAVVAMVYSVGKISGCHINPAVTLSMAITKRMPWATAVPYVVAQCVGGTLGGLAIWGVFAHKVHEAGVGHIAYAANTSIGSAMLNEGIGTAILLFTILGIVDKRGGADLLAGLVIGLIVIGIIITVAPQTGAAINPGRYTGTLITAQLAGLQPRLGPGLGVLGRRRRRRPRRRPHVRPAGAKPRLVTERRAQLGRERARARRDHGLIAPHLLSAAKESIVVSVTTQTVKKFVNDPEDVVPEALAGIAGAHPGLVRVDFDQQLIIRADAPVAGKVGLVSGGGSGHEPLHGGFVGARHARRGLRGRGLHLARAGSDAGGHEGRRRRRRRPAHRQELHRRRAQLPARRGARRGRRHRGRERADGRRLRRPGLAVHGRAAAASARPCWPRRSPVRAAEAGGTLGRGGGSAARDVNERARSFGVALTSCATPGQGHADLRPRPGRDRGRRRHPRRARPAPRAAHAARARSPR